MKVLEISDGTVYVQHRHKNAQCRVLYDSVDWLALAKQKLDLLTRIEGERGSQPEHILEGLVGLIDAIQDDAEARGYPVVWAYDADEWDRGEVELENDDE